MNSIIFNTLEGGTPVDFRFLARNLKKIVVKGSW